VRKVTRSSLFGEISVSAPSSGEPATQCESAILTVVFMQTFLEILEALNCSHSALTARSDGK
jgi:hypothetical protein